MLPHSNRLVQIASFRAFRREMQLATAVLLLTCGVRAPAQTQPPDDSAMRHQALLLCDQNNFVDALPLLEKLAEAHPTDFVIMERLGSALLGASANEPDAAKQKQMILRARSTFLRAKELGDKSDYLATMLEKLPENGEITPYSSRKEVDAVMREGEAAFNRSDFAAAIAAYQKALQIDPSTYDAALFTGDIYFRMNQMDKAGSWFAKAIAIDPEREAAYRYWGDALLKDRKMDEAKAKFIEAVICQPYQRTPWNGIHNWVSANHAALSKPEVDLPNSVSGGGKQINITLGPESTGKKDGSEAWVAYSLSKALWRGDKFKQQFPNEKEYRHSLAEEVDALNTAISVLSENYNTPKKRKKLQPSLRTLLELHEKGMIEPFILITKADAGIARDYAAYRSRHRDKLREYIGEWLIKPGVPSK